MTDGDDFPRFWDPIAEWLTANDIKLSDIPMMPEIELGFDNAGNRTIVMRSFYPNDVEKRTALFLRRGPALFIREWPLKAPIDDDVFEAYFHAQMDWVVSETVEALGRAGATVVRPARGDKILLLVAGPVSLAAQEQLHEIVGDVDLLVIDNVTAVVHAKGDQP
jgi:hypothetical protein